MNGIIPLFFEIKGYEGNPDFRMDTVVLADEKDLILIDAGTPNILPIIEKAFNEANIPIEQLTGIVITHQDQDHIGSLAAIKRRAQKALVYATAEQAPGISGTDKPMRLKIEEEEYEALSEPQRAAAPPPASLWPKVEYADIDVIVKDGDRFPWCGGTVIVGTQGHMPGHISLYVEATKSLIAGDAFVIENGKPRPSERFTFDFRLAVERLAEIGKKYKIEEFICYHGGFWRGDGSQVLKDFVKYL